MTKKIEDILSQIKDLKVTEVLKLHEGLKEVFQITDEDLNMSNGRGASEDSEKEEVVKEDPNKKVTIVMSSMGSETQIAVMKFLKELFGFAVSEIKAKITELASNPVILKSELSRKEAEEILAKLKASLPTASMDIK